MKKIIYVFSALLICTLLVSAQDEGSIVKKARIGKSKSLFIDFGPSFTLGKNIGDYSTGFNVELGFTKRMNRLLSIGPSFSFMSFKYDPETTSANGGGAYVSVGDPNAWGTKYDYDMGGGTEDYYYGYVLTLKGGDIKMLSLACNIKLNLWPVKDNSIVSPYLFAKPFVSYVSRSEVSGSDVRYTYEIYEDDGGTSGNTSDDLLYYDTGDGTWYEDGYTSTWGADTFDALKSENSFTGGVFVGPGVEFFPARRFSFFLQGAFGYTFPISFISTKSYESTVEDYVRDEFPMVKKGFPSVNVQVGASFNF
jgi:hypothetical protein